ncbi:MAG TPA: GxxExxY protein [Prolixibacteraceae bacterium]|nr:GxxExxY protein [Prolixibacteraceae bacterium]
MKNDQLNHLSGIILDACIDVHMQLGPGLLESVYEYCLCKELRNRSVKAIRQVPIPIFYKGEKIEMGFRADILVEEEVIIELKALREVEDIHRAQVITYLKVTGKKLGLLINFDVKKIVSGFERFVNKIDED